MIIMKKNISTKVLCLVIGALPFSLFFLFPFSLSAQSWAKKAVNAVFTLKTFDANGTLLASSNGVFVGENGEAVSSFTPFKGASRAVVIDAQGKEMPVECLIGANEMYDVAKFQVSGKKLTALMLAATPATNGATVWLLPYAVKKVPACIQGTVSNAEKFQGDYAYYTIAMTVDEQHMGCPILNDDGEVIGLLQPSADASSASSYAVSAPFANDLRISGLSLNDPVLRSVAIAKALPDNLNEAILSLYIGSSTMNAEEYGQYIDRFIGKFPNVPDGYIYHARNAVIHNDFATADEDMKQAVRVADPKDDAHYQYAQLIYQKVVFQNDLPYEAWTLDRAMEESEAAYRINPQPVYRQQQAQIRYAQQKYEEAYMLYDELLKGNMHNAETFYAAAQCKSQLNDQQASLALLDSAVCTFTKPYVKTAAPYLLARAQALYDAGKYRPAVNDYNDYESLMSTQIGAGFYFLREQAEFAGHLYQQALDDIRKAVEMEPAECAYQVEKANVELRVGMTDDALATAQLLIRLDDQQSEGYLLKGIAQCLKGNKQEGMENLRKAKELGSSQAQMFIEKYGL